MFSVKGKFGCPMLGKSCNFQHTCLQNTRCVTYSEWFIFQICLKTISLMTEGINSWPIFQFPQWRLWKEINQTFLTLHTGFLDKRERAPTLYLQEQVFLFFFFNFNATKLVFVWDTFSWNDPLENNVYKHLQTNSTLLTQAYHQCTPQQVLSASPWPVTAFTKALCSLAISGHFKYLCHEHEAQV